MASAGEHTAHGEDRPPPSGGAGGPWSAAGTWVEEDDGPEAAQLRLVHLHISHFIHQLRQNPEDNRQTRGQRRADGGSEDGRTDRQRTDGRTDRGRTDDQRTDGRSEDGQSEGGRMVRGRTDGLTVRGRRPAGTYLSNMAPTSALCTLSLQHSTGVSAYTHTRAHTHELRRTHLSKMAPTPAL